VAYLVYITLTLCIASEIYSQTKNPPGAKSPKPKVESKKQPQTVTTPPIEEKKEPESQSQFRLIMENDAFGGFSDRYYTNGTRLEFNTTASEKNLTRRIFGFWNQLFINESADTKYLMGFSVGQEFYTPTNIRKADISFGDRPYSSRGYMGNSLTTWSDSASVTTELELGMIGPSVGGKSAQINFHNLIGSPTPQGWDTQIPNSYSIGINTDVRKFWHRYFGTHYNVNLGNIYTNTSAGLIFRLGNVDKNPGPGFSALMPGAPILQNPGNGYWYFYINPGATLQVFNATIQGQIGSDNTYKNQSKDTALSNWDNFLKSPTYETGERELLFRTLSEDNGRNSLRRFILFNEYLVKGTSNPYDFGTNYLLFNIIFNGAEDIEKVFKLVLLKNISDNWGSLPDNARLMAVYSLFRPKGGEQPAFVRYYAYEILSQFILDPTQRNALLELLRQEVEFRENKTYTGDLKRAVGFFRAGFVSVSDGGFLFSINYNYQSIDFQSARGLPQQHQWIGFQLGKVY
jgi:hypothetical protein